MKDTITIEGVEYVKKSTVYCPAKEVDGESAVIIRSYTAGVFYGYLNSIEHTLAGTVVKLHNARRICDVHQWSGAASLSQMALDGVKSPDNCRFTVVLPEQIIVNCIEILPISEPALKSLNDVPVWKM